MHRVSDATPPASVNRTGLIVLEITAACVRFCGSRRAVFVPLLSGETIAAFLSSGACGVHCGTVSGPGSAGKVKWLGCFSAFGS